MDRFFAKVDKNDPAGCWLWTSFCHGGYGRFWFKGGYRLAHRFSYEMVNGPVNDGLFVLHRCDVRHCVNPDHLFLGTNADNMADMKAKGRAVCPARTNPSFQARGVDSGAAKLDDERVKKIRRMVAAGQSRRAAARLFGVDHRTVCAIVKRKTWAHVGDY